MSESKTRRWLAVCRMIVGALFLYNAFPKLTAQYLISFRHDVAVCASGNPFPWFESFLRQVVIPHQQLFAVFSVAGEVLTGVALLIGAFSGIACIAGMVFAACYMLATSHLTHNSGNILTHGFSAPNMYTITILLVLLIGRSGRVWGLGSRMGSRKGWLW